MTRIDRNSVNTKIYAYEMKQNVSNNFFLLLRMTPRFMALRTVYLLLSLTTVFVFTFEKFLYDLDPTEKPRYTYCTVFL